MGLKNMTTIRDRAKIKQEVAFGYFPYSIGTEIFFHTQEQSDSKKIIAEMN